MCVNRGVSTYLGVQHVETPIPTTQHRFFFPRNMEAVSDGHDLRFHQYIYRVEKDTATNGIQISMLITDRHLFGRHQQKI
jgi:hypothetical protein